MEDKKSTFALFFGNRGFFPASLQASAREELPQVLTKMGHKTLMLDADATRYGAVETPTAKGQIVDHAILKNAVGEGCSYGCNAGRIAPTPFTFGNLLMENGRMKFYLGQAQFTADEIPDDFFGCAGVAEFDRLQDTLQTIGYMGFRHHVSVSPQHTLEPVKEAFEKYLQYEVTVV